MIHIIIKLIKMNSCDVQNVKNSLINDPLAKLCT